MGLDINIVSVHRAVATKPTDAYVGSQYTRMPKWRQVAYERGAWELHDLLTKLYRKQGGAKEEFNNVNVRLYKRDLRLLCAPLAEAILEHMKKGRVVYAESSF
jgi:hypothetical protein